MFSFIKYLLPDCECNTSTLSVKLLKTTMVLKLEVRILGKRTNWKWHGRSLYFNQILYLVPIRVILASSSDFLLFWKYTRYKLMIMRFIINYEWSLEEYYYTQISWLAVASLIIKLYFQFNFKIEVSSSNFKIYNCSLESYKRENSWHNSTNTCSIKER